MKRTLIKHARLVSEAGIEETDVLIEDERIARIGNALSHDTAEVVDANGDYLFPGVIDDQVHFREPGLTHKATIYTESRAAVAGGITSFMEMPNTVPNALTQELLQDKYDIASRSSIANYSFFMGASNDNLEEVLKTDAKRVCGIKIFMGSSTGNMLVDDRNTLEEIFSRSPMLITTHCEDEATIRRNTEIYREKYGEDVPIRCHPEIRSEEACYLSSSMAVELARKHGTRLHILHISTAKEVDLFETLPLDQKMITAEACVHHLWFSDEDYDAKGTLIKWNPAVKKASDRAAIFQGVLDGNIDVIATDHAPHTLEEKDNTYFNAPSGGPLVQHSLVSMMQHAKNGRITLEMIAKKMCHNPARLFNIVDRGFVQEGYFADLVLVNPRAPWTVEKSNVLAKCGWSPFEGVTFDAQVTDTWVNGNRVFSQGKVVEGTTGRRLSFYPR